VQGGPGQRACLEECRAAGPGHGLACAAWRRLQTRDLAHYGVAAAAGLGAAPFHGAIQPQIRTLLPVRGGHLAAGRRAGSPTRLWGANEVLRCSKPPGARHHLNSWPIVVSLLEMQR
jgi:hypothetical protein